MPQTPDWKRVLETGMHFTEMRRSQAYRVAADLVAQGQLARDQIGAAVDELVEIESCRCSEELPARSSAPRCSASSSSSASPRSAISWRSSAGCGLGCEAARQGVKAARGPAKKGQPRKAPAKKAATAKKAASKKPAAKKCRGQEDDPRRKAAAKRPSDQANCNPKRVTAKQTSPRKTSPKKTAAKKVTARTTRLARRQDARRPRRHRARRLPSAARPEGRPQDGGQARPAETVRRRLDVELVREADCAPSRARAVEVIVAGRVSVSRTRWRRPPPARAKSIPVRADRRRAGAVGARLRIAWWPQAHRRARHVAVSTLHGAAQYRRPARRPERLHRLPAAP